MKFNTIINFIDEHNEGGIILSKIFQVQNVILIAESENENSIEKIKDIYIKVMPNVNIETLRLKVGDYVEIGRIVNINSKNDTIFNLTGGARINSLIFQEYIIKNDLKSVYIDVKNKKLYYFDKEIKVFSEEIIDLDISDIAHAGGADILIEATDLVNKIDIIEITKKIQSNIDIWHKYKQRLYDNTTFAHDYRNTNMVTIYKDKLNLEEYKIVDRSIKFLNDLNGIKVIETKNEIQVTFLNNYLKGFIFKSGTWLEVFTNLVVREIKEIDESKSGVLFFWNDEARMVKNELDVVAIKDSVLICISCKDSDKYDENALNELSIYAKKLGGDNAKKVLVATKKPIKISLIERAKQMGISIIILDKDVNKFRNELNYALK